ncbi:hypothetical protein ABTN51_20335, partial [Acinetobacter baumannii]
GTDHRVEGDGAWQQGDKQKRSDKQSLTPGRCGVVCAKPMHMGFYHRDAAKGSVPAPIWRCPNTKKGASMGALSRLCRNQI